MNKILTVLLYIFICSSQGLYAHALPESHAVNGGLTLIPLELKKKPEAYFQEKRVPVVAGSKVGQWLLIVAIPLDTQDSVQYITLKKPYKARLPFYVSDKWYTTQYLSIKDINKVDPRPEDKTRINKEAKRLALLFSNYSKINPFQQKFTAPVRGPITSLFGLKRVYNKEPRDPHSGLDIATKKGEPVHAIAQGTIVETGDYFFTGNTVIIDHGMGVFSLYAHLDKTEVTAGEPVSQGQTIGLAGMTGRVTGPHLHWTMVVNQTLVDPLLFVPARDITPAPVLPPRKVRTDLPNQQANDVK